MMNRSLIALYNLQSTFHILTHLNLINKDGQILLKQSFLLLPTFFCLATIDFHDSVLISLCVYSQALVHLENKPKSCFTAYVPILLSHVRSLVATSSNKDSMCDTQSLLGSQK